MSNTYKSLNIPTDFDSGSGGGGTGLPPYTSSFNNTTSWTLDGDSYAITVPAGVHERGANVIVKAYEAVVDIFEEVDLYVSKTAAGTVTIKVGLNNRFSGKLIIIGE